MSSWILYATLASLLFAAAALALERTALSFPRRWIWVAALGASAVVPLLGRGEREPELFPPAGEIAVAPAVAGVSAPPAAAASPPRGSDIAGWLRAAWPTPSLPAAFDRWALLSWLLLSAAVVRGALRSSAALARARRSWTVERVDGRDVLVSEDTGPALVGVARPTIVMPRWALRAPPADRELMLRHEEEHRRARDPQVLFAATVLVALLPWNLPLWWQARRLRMAAELDCDRRVLRGSADLRRYATLLVEMSRRAAAARLGTLALANPTSLLERRIRTMTRSSRPSVSPPRRSPSLRPFSRSPLSASIRPPDRSERPNVRLSGASPGG